ncbi:MAG: POTRA domain-containing protein [Bacteroidota bacterium]|nr:POTRA domain-containing protein [Bacteroidota bacterium]
MILKNYIWKQKPIVLSVWLFLFAAIGDAQPKISSIEFFGNTFFSQRQLLEKIPAKVGSPFLPMEQINASVLDLYRSEGFYNFTIDSSKLIFNDDSTSIRLIFYLDEKIRTTISVITVIGNSSIPTGELLSLIESRIGTPLNAQLLESDIQSILQLYSRRGFPFTKINSDSIQVDSDDVSKLIVKLTVEEGAKVYLDEIQTEGNSTTSSQVIVREARINKGELFDQEQIVRIQKRLERMQLFSSVAEPQLYIVSQTTDDSLRGGLLISVKEGSTNTFDGILGYVPPLTPNTDGYFTGNVFVAMRNLFGTGRKALIRWQRETETTQEIELQYREPWLFGIPLNLGGTFYQRKQDSTYVKTKFEFRGDFIVTEEFSVAGNITSESVYPSADLQQFSIFESSALFFGAEILYDTRDNLRNPTSGLRYSTTVQQGRKSISGPEKYLYLATEKDFSIQRYSVDAEVYVTTFARQVIMLSVHGKQISSSRLEVSDLFQFGGTTTLRGYRENQFFASQLAYINSEYRFLTGRASSLFGFADGGYFSRPSDALRGIVRQEKSLYGFGFGARIETGLGIMNISYALGQGDSFSNGKIHVGIINEF